MTRFNTNSSRRTSKYTTFVLQRYLRYVNTYRKIARTGDGLYTPHYDKSLRLSNKKQLLGHGHLPERYCHINRTEPLPLIKLI